MNVMKKVTKDVLKDASLRLMFAMTEEQYDLLFDEFKILIQQMELIGKIDGLDHVTPMTFPFNVTTEQLAEDIPKLPLSQERALSNVKLHVEGQVKLPKVVG
jgi:aspartyl/glutamyl-tRNA(Asn/Gln) amidotransferase C subunit